jgi:hypothetical protein
MRALPAHCTITSQKLHLVDNLGWWASAKGCAGIPWGGAGGIGDASLTRILYGTGLDLVQKIINFFFSFSFLVSCTDVTSRSFLLV